MLYSKDYLNNMKKYIIFGSILFIVIAGLVGYDLYIKTTNKIDVTHFELSYSPGMTAGYRLIYGNESIYVEGYENIYGKKSYNVDSAFKEKLENIITKYKVLSWNGFNKHEKNIYDAAGFSLNITNVGKEIKASGYADFPNNFYGFQNEIENLFESYIRDLK